MPDRRSGQGRAGAKRRRTAVNFLVLEGPGQVERLRGAFLTRHWSVLVNTNQEEAGRLWHESESAWTRDEVFSIGLTPLVGLADLPSPPGDSGDGFDGVQLSPSDGWTARLLPDERRPGRSGMLLDGPDLTIAVNPSPDSLEPIQTRRRAVILDASWTHIARFPEREEVREALADALQSTARSVYFVTNLPWDADLFRATAQELGSEERAQLAFVDGIGQRLLWQVREVVARVRDNDMVLMGLVPGRDDRGAYQRLRSDFAARTEHVRVYPTVPLSTGPGLSREEATDAVGTWLPTSVLIAGGPISEQMLLCRHLETAVGDDLATVAVVGGEYRLPGLACARQRELAPFESPATSGRVQAAKAGLVLVTFDRANQIRLYGAGLTQGAREVLDKLKVDRRGKSPDAIVHSIEHSFRSRGLPVPSVRLLTT